VILRDYGDLDARATLDVFLRAIRQTASADYSPEQVAVWARDDIDVESWAAKRTAAGTIVAVVDGVVAGFTDVDGSGYIDMMFVDPRCARRGVASALLARVFDVANERKVDELSVHASVTARPFFERHGFFVIEEQHPIRDGVTMVNFRMSGSVPKIRDSYARGQPSSCSTRCPNASNEGPTWREVGPSLRFESTRHFHSRMTR
jgi:putative acetyltransferase